MRGTTKRGPWGTKPGGSKHSFAGLPIKVKRPKKSPLVAAPKTGRVDRLRSRNPLPDPSAMPV